jgi:hypothetical protein
MNYACILSVSGDLYLFSFTAAIVASETLGLGTDGSAMCLSDNLTSTSSFSSSSFSSKQSFGH